MVQVKNIGTYYMVFCTNSSRWYIICTYFKWKMSKNTKFECHLGESYKINIIFFFYIVNLITYILNKIDDKHIIKLYSPVKFNCRSYWGQRFLILLNYLNEKLQNVDKLYTRIHHNVILNEFWIQYNIIQTSYNPIWKRTVSNNVFDILGKYLNCNVYSNIISKIIILLFK